MSRRGPLDIGWIGNSKRELLEFPKDVRVEFGHNLWLLQNGEPPTCEFRSLATLMTGVYELKEQDESGWYRVTYLTPIAGVLYVIHCFQKQSRRMSKSDEELIVKRVKELKQKLAKKR